jgi:hypothetical protein
MKRVLLIVIDALASRVVLPALDEGRLPTLRALAQAGALHPACSAMFPSITPAATASILTGCYPRDHGIVGQQWYDAEHDEVAYFGADIEVIVERGIGTFIEDFLVQMNNQRLQADTLYQLVERNGQQAACLNYLFFRGDVPHTVDVPLLLQVLPDVDENYHLYGPSILRLGDFVAPDSSIAAVKLSESGPLNSYGMKDKHTAQTLLQMAERRTLPAFTLAYFPENDFASHANGPAAALEKVERVDSWLGELVAAYGGLEALLDEVCIVLTGDHSQTDVLPDDAAPAIDLSEVLADFAIAEAGDTWDDDEQLLICPNMRATCIYLRQPTPERIDAIARALLADERVDQVIWAAALTEANAAGHHIVTRERGRLHFWPGGDGAQHASDQYGGRWSWTGDLRAVDGQLTEHNGDTILTFSSYPNAFERIACAPHVADGLHLWVTAHPGYEFVLPRIKLHPKGSHGSLHEDDSTMPLLLAGAPAGVTLPEQPRIVDVAPLCLAVLGITPRYAIGASHLDNEHRA